MTADHASVVGDDPAIRELHPCTRSAYFEILRRTQRGQRLNDGQLALLISLRTRERTRENDEPPPGITTQRDALVAAALLIDEDERDPRDTLLLPRDADLRSMPAPSDSPGKWRAITPSQRDTILILEAAEYDAIPRLKAVRWAIVYARERLGVVPKADDPRWDEWLAMGLEHTAEGG
jgi:hypothetical protein